MITIYHNPRCSKSREALALAEQYSSAQQIKLEVIDYQKTPLTLAQLKTLHGQLGGPVSAMVRDNEAEYAELNLAQADDAALLQALAAHPKLLQRPVVTYRERAVIARPPGVFNELLDT
ncbi:arsenate reductase [Collimonas sp. OK242]|jgi:arsenate reductase|uniref:arsenate reductase (glutaredoxin) n=1 Tax=Collimonas sp. OK242 TaxID=1798195 RepID=UPI0008986CC6|nr:arsenate reductase (glutaredoxin) [Collimonas sp. OK242]SDY95110.1 arsenate reductase [Collimonas sp. OK242]